MLSKEEFKNTCEMAKERKVTVKRVNPDDEPALFNICSNEVKSNRGIIFKSVFEKDLVAVLQTLPIKKDLIEQENKIIECLVDEELSTKEKINYIKKYSSVYSTHNFAKFMNVFTRYICTEKQLVLTCCDVCKKCKINNLSNNKPIAYMYCNAFSNKLKITNNIKTQYEKYKRGVRKKSVDKDKNNSGK